MRAVKRCAQPRKAISAHEGRRPLNMGFKMTEIVEITFRVISRKLILYHVIDRDYNKSIYLTIFTSYMIQITPQITSTVLLDVF